MTRNDLTPTRVNAQADPTDNALLVEEVWVSGSYELVRTQRRLADGSDVSARWFVRTLDSDLPDLAATSRWDAAVPTYGVNWSAMGTRDADEARTYAAALVRAAFTADLFTDIAAARSVSPDASGTSSR